MRDLVMTEFKTAVSQEPRFPFIEVKEMWDIDDISMATEVRRMFEELLRGEDLDLGFTFNPKEICPKATRQKIMRQFGAALNEATEQKIACRNQLPPLPPSKKMKKTVSFVLEPSVMNKTAMHPQAYCAENPGYGQGGKSRQSAMKKSGPSQQQQQANSETKEAIHGNAKTQVVKSTPSSSAAPPCSKVGDEVVPTGVDPKLSGNFHSQCQASGSHILATQSKEEARPAAFQASSAEETLDPTKIRPGQLKKGPIVLVSTGNHSGTQPLGDLNGQVPFPSRGNVMQSANGIQRAKVQDFKASPEARALNHAGHKKEKENIPPVLCTKINRIQDLPEAVTMGKSPEQKLLRALGKLPVCSTVLAQPEATSVPEAVEATGQGNTSHFSHVEEMYHEFMRVSGKTTNALEINVLDVSELFARCVDPNSKNAQSNSTNHNSANKDKQHFEQRDTERSNDFYREYCPAPSFDLGIDDLPTGSADNRAHQHVGSSTFAEHEFKELPVHNQPIIDITEDDYLLDVEGIDPCVQAEGNVYQTPEKSSNQGEVGSGSKIYSSSSSGEMHPHQFERRIIKPPPCKRSPFIDYNEKKVYMSKPEANRLYASVILHGRINEEESPDVDTRYDSILLHFFFVSFCTMHFPQARSIMLSRQFKLCLQAIHLWNQATCLSVKFFFFETVSP